MKQFLKFLLILLLSLGGAGGGSLYAQKQGQSKIDSLFTELPRQKEDTNKAKLVTELGYIYYQVGEADSGIKYGQRALEMSTQLGYKNGIARANIVLGASNLSKSDHARALQFFITALKQYEDLGNKVQIAKVYMNIGNVYSAEGDYPKALENAIKAFNISEELGDKSTAAMICGNIGGIYGGINDYPRSMEYLFKALNRYDELGNGRKLEKSMVLSNIGYLYQLQNDCSNALQYDFKALEIDEELGNKDNAANTTGNIAVVYAKQKNYIGAIIYAQRSLQMSREIGSKRLEAWALYEIGNAYLSLCENASDDKSKISVTGETASGKYQPGSANGSIPAGRAARLRLALDYLQQGLDSAKKIQAVDLMQVTYKRLSDVYRLNGDYKRSLEASDNYQVIKDSIFSKDNREQMLKLAMKNEYERQRLADSLKIAEKEKIANINLQKQKGYTYLGITGILLLAGFSFFIVKERGKSENERKKSDGLLLNILPGEVAEELKLKGTTTAKNFDDVTVLFTDFVDFTQAGERMSPQELVNELHTCFKKFDEITGRHNVEKIKTIGDAYLAVSGLPTTDARHAENVVRAATEINAFMQDRLAKLGNSTFEVRIGIHSGSVVAGIVGVKKFAYDIWGDTVNTAARMEQNSEPGKINISQTTYELVKDKFTCEYRGEIDAKGKGMMKMYYVS